MLFETVFGSLSLATNLLLDSTLMASVLSTMAMPVIGVSTLLSAKLASGESLAKAQRRFFACLLVITIVTLRTVIVCDDAWIFHMSTLALMIVGALIIPDHDASVAV
ncbi:hypothetical protein [Crateriforma conspicua]|uniref:Uncharacterized protein n=1 Tax=Crateriforma conspicua TaxID=2527996 RepID=A0A5C6FV88_9PLAN|nr:hypothetical protein [Crateriforma conspicua]TWU66311.1 hypothetical protein V7x_18750 [Crateriforma conspicua]